MASVHCGKTVSAHSPRAGPCRSSLETCKKDLEPLRVAIERIRRKLEHQKKPQPKRGKLK